MATSAAGLTNLLTILAIMGVCDPLPVVMYDRLSLSFPLLFTEHKPDFS